MSAEIGGMLGTEDHDAEAAPDHCKVSAAACPGTSQREVGHAQSQEAEAGDLAGAEKEASAVELSTIIAEAQWCSSQASSGVRFLAVGGFAVTWLLAGSRVSGLRVGALPIALALFIGVMAADFVQYSTAARLWTNFLREQAAQGKGPEDRAVLPGEIYEVTTRRYSAKIVLLISAYVALSFEFLRAMFGS